MTVLAFPVAAIPIAPVDESNISVLLMITVPFPALFIKQVPEIWLPSNLKFSIVKLPVPFPEIVKVPAFQVKPLPSIDTFLSGILMAVSENTKLSASVTVVLSSA